MTIPELIEILKAVLDRKPIEYRAPSHAPNVRWIEILEPNCEIIVKRLAAGFEVRVRPEAREWWLNVDSYGYPLVPNQTEEDAIRRTAQGQKPIRVREVLP